MPNVMADGLLSFRLLQVGGLMVFDDMFTYLSVARATAAIVEALGGEGRLEVLYDQVRHFLTIAFREVSYNTQTGQ